MLLSIAWFEIRYWIRSWMLWTFLVLVAVLVCGAMSSDEVMADFGLSNIYHNSPFTIATFYSILGIFTLLMTAIFVNSSALRDFSHDMQQIIFSTPLRRSDFLIGRFLGAIVVSLIPLLGVSIGILAAPYFFRLHAEQWNALNWAAHFKSILFFALPNTFLIAAILFAAAIVWRREIASFIAFIILFTARSISGQIFQDVHQERIRGLLDPFGARAFSIVTKYWTVAEKNTLSPELTSLLLWNRVIWIGIGCAAFAIAYFRFSFSQKSAKPKALEAKEDRKEADIVAPAIVEFKNSSAAKFAGTLRMHIHTIARDPAFIVIVFIASVICLLALVFGGTRFSGNETFRIFPVAYAVIDLIGAFLNFFLMIIVVYFSGVLVWKDREDRMDAITDAAPADEWISYAARLAALMIIVVIILAIAITVGILFQALHNFHRFQFNLYIDQLLLRSASGLFFFAILSFFIQTIAPNKYAGYFTFLVFYCLNTFGWPALNVGTNLVQFASRPVILYSDFFGDAPYRAAWNWFTLYWLLFCCLLVIATVMLWRRGKEERWNARIDEAALRFNSRWKCATAICILLFVSCGAWIYYNTEISNQTEGPNDSERIQANYEKKYKKFDKLPQPRVRDVKYRIDLFPSDRNVDIHGEEIIYNPYSRPIQEIHFSLDPHYNTTIEMPDAAVANDDKRLSYRIYRFTNPLQPGEERTMHFRVTSKNRGFENQLRNPQLMPNGTFLSNLGTLIGQANYVAPVIGYNYWREIIDSAVRKTYGLPEIDLMPAPERNCSNNCRDTYIPGHADWVSISAIISTSPDQIAVAPGSLIREWQQNGRRFFEYKLDHASMNLYCFASAHYQIAQEEWNGIKLQIYYLKEHPWNIPRMMNSMKKSLDYYTRNFGRYAHKEARIVEFPRVSEFAAAFASTMPYSESFGFIADLSNPDDIDNVFYVVAHEIAHQWWDEQVIGANMEGATLLSETLAQYSSLLVMEKEYGREMMRKFLRYEMDQYLRARAQQHVKENPLLKVNYRQSYIHYSKGSVALYYLKEMIGEEAVNRALRKLIRQYSYAPPPYPTSYALVDDLGEETPSNLRYLIKDLFEEITLFSNRTLTAVAKKLPDGKYDVTIQVEARKFKADGSGNESEVPVDDWIDIGAFGKPAEGREYGSTLYRERIHITQRNSTFTFATSQLPDRAGIDPFALLIDRSPDDNLLSVTIPN